VGPAGRGQKSRIKVYLSCRHSRVRIFRARARIDQAQMSTLQIESAQRVIVGIGNRRLNAKAWSHSRPSAKSGARTAPSDGFMVRRSMLARPGFGQRNHVVVSFHRRNNQQRIHLRPPIQPLAPNALPIARQQASVYVRIERRQLDAKRRTRLLGGVKTLSMNRRP